MGLDSIHPLLPDVLALAALAAVFALAWWP